MLTGPQAPMEYDDAARQDGIRLLSLSFTGASSLQLDFENEGEAQAHSQLRCRILESCSRSTALRLLHHVRAVWPSLPFRMPPPALWFSVCLRQLHTSFMSKGPDNVDKEHSHTGHSSRGQDPVRAP